MLKAATREQFKLFLGEQALRLTPQRTAILEAALKSEEPFTAEDLLLRSKKIDSSVSRSTTYRTISLLISSKLFREIDIGKDHKYYTLSPASSNFQAQIICANCDKIFEIDAPFMDWYSKGAAGKLQMQATSARLQVVAECCRGCLNKPHIDK